METFQSSTVRQKGTSIVEFALVLPLYLLLLFGIVEFSVILFDKAVITNASRVAARQGIVFRDGDRSYGSVDLEAETNAVKAIVDDYAADYLLSFGGDSSITTSVSHNDVNGNGAFDAGDQLIVDVTYPYSYLALPAFVETLADFNLGATTVMLAE